MRRVTASQKRAAEIWANGRLTYYTMVKQKFRGEGQGEEDAAVHSKNCQDGGLAIPLVRGGRVLPFLSLPGKSQQREPVLDSLCTLIRPLVAFMLRFRAAGS